jgi:hypothetical protein
MATVDLLHQVNTVTDCNRVLDLPVAHLDHRLVVTPEPRQAELLRKCGDQGQVVCLRRIVRSGHDTSGESGCDFGIDDRVERFHDVASELNGRLARLVDRRLRVQLVQPVRFSEAT